VRGKNYNAGLRGVLFEARHCARMGQAVWLYGWLVLRETRERNGIGFVLGGRPVSYREIEEETGFARKTLQRWMQVLRQRGYIETTTAPAGIIVRIQKAKKFLRQGVEGSANSFQQGCVRDEGKLWKSPETTTEPLLKSGAPHLKNEERCPQICGGEARERAESARLPGGICSGTIERQIDKKQPSPSGGLRTTITAAESSNLQESCSEKQNNLNVASRDAFVSSERYATSIAGESVPEVFRTARRRPRDAEVTRELRVGAGPEVRR
jgi:hypothetical protein